MDGWVSGATGVHPHGNGHTASANAHTFCDWPNLSQSVVIIFYPYLLFYLIPRRGLYDPKMHRVVGFVYMRFRDELYWWELVEVFMSKIAILIIRCLPPVARHHHLTPPATRQHPRASQRRTPPDAAHHSVPPRTLISSGRGSRTR